ncbi:MAG: DUF2892 domain-containing protein [Proteobacteria bacterium]|jgi:hypothetical protein|nr:DUF2892 domain-containing protein [Pseudomonadota bacterium]
MTEAHGIGKLVFMKINLAFWDRALRYFFGVWLTAWALAGGPWWSYVGVYAIITASWGICPVYGFFKLKTAKITESSLAFPEDSN